MNSQLSEDLVVGIKAISREIGIEPRKANYLAAAGLLPGVFKRGRQWVGLKSEIARGFRNLASPKSEVA